MAYSVAQTPGDGGVASVAGDALLPYGQRPGGPFTLLRVDSGVAALLAAGG